MRRTRPRLLDLRSGGAVLLLAAVLSIATALLWVQRLAGQPATVGDGRHVASYGFDLKTCLVPRDPLVAAGFPKDGVPALTEPEVFTPPQLHEFAAQTRRAHQGKYLVDGERVIGVVRNGAARAYPLRIITWHEVVNDTLGGQPIAVTYHPLCDSVVVFDRRVGEETLTFGVSGLLYNSNLLMYDRRTDPVGESLWCQLQFRAIAGPAAAAGRTLTVLTAAVLPWSQWRERYPETTVLAPDRSRLRVYKNTYGAYFGSDRLRFPVRPLPADGRPLKTPMMAIRADGDWQVHALPDILTLAGDKGVWRTSSAGTTVEFDCRSDPPTVAPRGDEAANLQVVYVLWFAWFAMHPDG